jgi:hypothetical protein
MKKLFVIVAILFSGILLTAQEAILSTGADVSGSGGSVSYSTGQVFFKTHPGTNDYSIAEGVQQPYEISVVTGFEEADEINLMYMAFPNPSTDILKLKVVNYENNNLSFHLYTMNGELLENKKLTGNITTISVAHLSSATYFLTVIENQKRIKTFKIIKN